MLQTLAQPSAAPRTRLAALEHEVSSVREAMFAVTDNARYLIANDFTELHVSLQMAANELGRVERMLRHARDV